MDKYFVYYDDAHATGLIQFNTEKEVTDFITDQINNDTVNPSISNYIVFKGKKLGIKPEDVKIMTKNSISSNNNGKKVRSIIEKFLPLSKKEKNNG